MVIHSPVKAVVHQPADAQGAVGGAAHAASDPVPPSVLAASSRKTETATADLLGGQVHDFTTWRGGDPAGKKQEEEELTIPAGTNRENDITGDEDPDRISPADDPADAPQLNPFTPEWFAQLVGAAANAAATAAATAVATSRPPPAASLPLAPSSAPAPRRLNERKVPDFWEDRPEFWFRIFDDHLSHFNPGEQRSFDTLLPLLTSAARAIVHSVIRSPGTSPYTKAREALLRHFGRTPRQQAREMRDARDMGDKLPSEFLDHLMGLLPNVRTLFEVALLDALPANARVAALQHTDVFAMARAADAVVLENRAAEETNRTLSPSVNAMSLLDSELDSSSEVPAPLAPSPASISAIARRPAPRKPSDLCSNHARWGKETFKCAAPRMCKMRNITIPRPSSSSSAPPASGNGRAGGQ